MQDFYFIISSSKTLSTYLNADSIPSIQWIDCWCWSCNRSRHYPIFRLLRFCVAVFPIVVVDFRDKIDIYTREEKLVELRGEEHLKVCAVRFPIIPSNWVPSRKSTRAVVRRFPISTQPTRTDKGEGDEGDVEKRQHLPLASADNNRILRSISRPPSIIL